MNRDNVIARIAMGARTYGLPVDAMVALAYHESRLDPNCVGDNGESIGLYQIQRLGSTYESIKTLARWAGRDAQAIDLRNPTTSAILACIGHRQGYGHWWHAWVNVPPEVRPPRDHFIWRHAPQSWLDGLYGPQAASH